MTKSLNRSDVLEALGLSTKQSRRNDLTDTVLPALGLFGAGLLVGAGLALAMAPKAGRDLRADVYRGAGSLGNNLKDRLPMRRSDDARNTQDDIHATATQPRS